MPDDGRLSPYNIEAEESLLGAMLLNLSALRIGLAQVTASDFYRPAHVAIWSAMRDLHASGAAVDPTTVADELRRRGEEKHGTGAQLVSLQVRTPATSSAARYAAIVADHALMRGLIRTGGYISELGYARPADVGDAIDEAKAALSELAMSAAGPAENLVESLDDICAEPEDERDWVIPDLLDRSDRMIVVAHPGMGKTMMFRQFAVMVGQGIHPLRFNPIPRVRALLVDFENPRGIIRRTCQPIVAQAHRSARPYEVDRAGLYHRPGGIDIRKRADFVELDAAIAEFQPDLVCLGPLYKAYRSAKGETYEDVATDVTGRFDDLRTRHGFALLIEHHAGKDRQMVPQGSAVWERWPEFGFGLIPHRPNDRSVLDWTDWRGPREVRDWPTQLHRGQFWPWEATFAEQRKGAA
jgi:hypothetical protein